MSDIAIRVDKLSKLYPEPAARACRLGAVHQRPDTTSADLSAGLRDALTTMFRRPHDCTNERPHGSPDDLWALKDVSFEACPEPSRRAKRGELVDTRVRAVDGHSCQAGSPQGIIDFDMALHVNDDRMDRTVWRRL